MNFDQFGLDFSNPDFVKYAESYGAIGHRVESTEHFDNVLNKCVNSKGVHIIDVPIDYSENNKVLYEELQNKTCIL
jgi:acetolactate synthase-1/2/3 large subunit